MGIKIDNKLKHKHQKLKSTSEEKENWLKRDIALFGQKFGSTTKAYFYTELHILLESGISLKQSLSVIEEGLKKKTEKDIISKLSDKIIKGASLSDAMKTFDHFLKYEYFSIKIGEETGTLSKVVKQLADYFERKTEYRKNIISALTYPLIILSTAVLVILFMLRYVVPMFEEIFRQQQVELPGITLFIVNVSQFIQSYAWGIIISFVVLIMLFFWLNKNDKFKQFQQRVLFRIPGVNTILKVAYTTQFIQAMSILLSAKVPMLNALYLVKDMIGFYPLKLRLNTIIHDIQKGMSLSQAIAKHSVFFKADVMAMVSVAEQTNATAYIFDKLSHRYNNMLQRQSKTLSTFLEPIIILIVGVFVGFILVAMYLPMFKLSTVMG